MSPQVGFVEAWQCQSSEEKVSLLQIQSKNFSKMKPSLILSDSLLMNKAAYYKLILSSYQNYCHSSLI